MSRKVIVLDLAWPCLRLENLLEITAGQQHNPLSDNRPVTLYATPYLSTRERPATRTYARHLPNTCTVFRSSFHCKSTTAPYHPPRRPTACTRFTTMVIHRCPLLLQPSGHAGQSLSSFVFSSPLVDLDPALRNDPIKSDRSAFMPGGGWKQDAHNGVSK